ncbi:MAG: pyruvate:ferredoxin (flavodoxin) oxidoreductase [Lachnospiraceae bacterium]|nr:pyruvate:ferredoxin (flavodoxin) oxidoreductase [Lachnospiraceae bacterium]
MKKEMQMMDGNTAAAHVSYAFTEVAAIFPITPSSPMAGLVDSWAANGKKNIFGQKVLVKEMQSEAGASGTVHGSLQGGALTSTYTASQGLLLMIPNMYKIAGELLPGVFHVSSRSLSSNVVSIFGDHQDVMSTRQTGFSLLASTNAQQCMDLGAVAHLSAIDARLPFLHFFDGFRTSHEVSKVEVLQYDDLKKLLNMKAVEEFKGRALNPDHPELRGITANPDIFFQYREAGNKFHNAVPGIVEENMKKINALTGRDYKLFNYHGSPTAEKIIIAMGSACDTIKQTIGYLNKNGENLGLIEVHLFRPFSVKHLLAAVPGTVKKIAVLDRTKEPGAREPLFLDVRNAFYGQKNAPLIVGGRFGLASKEFTPHDVMSVYANLEKDEPMDAFTVGIVDDVTYTSLPKYEKDIDPTPEGTTACKFWGLGSDGTVSANKSAIKIIGDHTDMYAQAYFAYDSKKSGGLTVSHLRFGKSVIEAPYLVTKADFIACHNQFYVYQYDLLEGIKKGGRFLLNCEWSKEELDEKLPNSLKRRIAENDVCFYTINAIDIARGIGLGGRINMIMQAAFFKLADIIPIDDAVKYLKDAVKKSYGRQGQNVVDMNNAAIDKGISAMVKIDVPEGWASLKDEEIKIDPNMPEFMDKIIIDMNRQKGDALPVSAFNGREDGTFPLGISKWEKRGIAIDVPYWDSEKCIQCNQCSFVCSHGVIRPLLLDDETVKNAPEGLVTKPATGFPGKSFYLAISALDCTGCGNCENICPAKGKALHMKPLEANRDKLIRLWNYVEDYENEPIDEKNKASVKGSQFFKPLIEFSGACAGCGETPYVKLITQLYGDRMTMCCPAGCTAVWGASPAVAYTTNKKGHGPAFGYSLFEDNGEYGFGLYLGSKTKRNMLLDKVKEALEADIPSELKNLFKDWIQNFDNDKDTRKYSDDIEKALLKYKDKNPLIEGLYKMRDSFVKQSYWIIGGDGWAYDIGFGGLDHVLASGENVNVLVLDTEVYSNTGGQSSKATPTAAIAQFAASGKKTRKKDLGVMAMSYGYIYVAQIAMGADKTQTLKAIREAEAYPGPSLVIAYAPCVNHGIKGGMGHSQEQEKLAVEAGYWSLYRYNPVLKDEGKNPFVLDSKDPTADFKGYLMSEVRYSSLFKLFPDSADELFSQAAKDATDRIENYHRIAGK